jgi:hypothetical protein
MKYLGERPADHPVNNVTSIILVPKKKQKTKADEPSTKQAGKPAA